MSRLHVSPDSGNTWNPVRSLRLAPGGPDTGQTDKSSTDSESISGGLTKALWTVSAGKTGYIADLEVYLSASSCTVQLQVGGVTVWQAVVTSTAPAYMRRAWPIVAGAGQAVQLVFSSAVATATFNLGAWEQS